MTTTIRDILEAILSRMNELGQIIGTRLQPGLDVNRIVELTKAVGLNIPKTVCDLYSWRNGTVPQAGDSWDDINFLPGYHFLPLEKAIESYKIAMEVLDEGGPSTWRKGWLPLFGNDCGDYYVIECKKPAGEDGRIRWILEGSDPEICYKGLLSMLLTMEESYRVGAYYEDEGGCLEVDEKKHGAIARKHNPRVKYWTTVGAATVKSDSSEATLSDKKLVKQVQAAAHEVRCGLVDSGYSKLKTLVANSVDAAVSLAEIEAFHWNWEEAIRHVEHTLKCMKDIKPGNVLSDMIGLLCRAGRESNAWDLVAHAAQEAMARDEWSYNIVQDLLKWATSSGRIPLKSLGSSLDISFNSEVMSKLSSEQKTVLYCDAVAKLKTRDRDAQTLFSLARNCEQYSEAVGIYEENESQMRFDQGIYVAKLLVRSNQLEKAWNIVERKVSTWWPVSIFQVAPVILLIDEDLRKIMNKDRCAWILATPRGPEAVKK